MPQYRGQGFIRKLIWDRCGDMAFYIQFVVVIVSILFLVWIGRVIYFAFIKKKDTNEKILVMKTIAHPFIIIFVANTINFLISSIGHLNFLFENIGTGVEIHPAAINIILLGITISINKRRVKAISKNQETSANGMDV